MANDSKNTNIYSLIAQAFDSLRDDMQGMVTENKEEMTNALNDSNSKMDTMAKIIEAMKTNLEFMHKQLRDNNRKVEALAQRIEEKDEVIQKLEEEIGRIGGRSTENDGDIPGPGTDSNDACTSGGISVKESANTNGGKDQKITFEHEVSGKNVVIGTEVAAFGEGAELKFTKPPSNDPYALTNYKGDLGEEYGSQSGNGGNLASMAIPDALKDSTLVGNERVNIMSNTQQVFLADASPSNVEVDEDGEKIQYREADAEELADYLEQKRKETGSGGDGEEPLNPEDAVQKRDVILRMAKLLRARWTNENFIRLTELLLPLKHNQLLSLGPQLLHITSVDLTGLQVHFDLLNAFYRCFRSKSFLYLSLSGSRVNAKDVQKLAAALRTNKIEYLNLGRCWYEYMAFFNLASLFPHIGEVDMKALTSSVIVMENALSPPRQFSAEDATHLSESIMRCEHMIGLHLADCDFTDEIILSALLPSLQKVDRLILKNSKISINGMKLILSKMPKNMLKLDLSSTDLRSVGMELVCGYIARIKVLQLSNVMMDDENFHFLTDSLSKLPEKSMAALDVSFNAIGIDSVAKLLTYISKVGVIVFSENQIQRTDMETTIAKYLQGSGLSVSISEVVNGRMCRLEKIDPTGFTHWVATSGAIDNATRENVMALTLLPRDEVNERNIPEFRCRKCKTHIAFPKDAIAPPCSFLYNDRKFFGVFDKPFFTAVTRATSCSPDESKKAKKHVCTASKCPISSYKKQVCKCDRCEQTIGGFYADGNGNQFWCLYQDAQGALDVGGKNLQQKIKKTLSRENM